MKISLALVELIVLVIFCWCVITISLLVSGFKSLGKTLRLTEGTVIDDQDVKYTANNKNYKSSFKDKTPIKSPGSKMNIWYNENNPNEIFGSENGTRNDLIGGCVMTFIGILVAVLTYRHINKHDEESHINPTNTGGASSPKSPLWFHE
jgi:hypothetical protein